MTAEAAISPGVPPQAAPRPRALSPSRAADFMHCPLLYRFRTIDRLPEPPDAMATRGTVVHAVLERLFDFEPEELADLFADDGDGAALAEWLTSAEQLLSTYFDLEDPTRLRQAERELIVECELPSGVRLRGIVDRLDIAPDGALRVVDYKTGRAPDERFEARALFQMKFYALVLWRTRGVIPRVLQLLYLGNREVLRYAPDEADLRATERKVQALWAAITQAEDRQDFRASPGRLCDWCSFHALCPAKGGTLPAYPVKGSDESGETL